MKFLHPFPRKSRKLALSFDYVHDRYMLLPGYLEKFALYLKIFAVILGCILFFGLWRLWGGDLMRFVKPLLPQGAPEITVVPHVYTAHLQGQQDAWETWEASLEEVSVHSLDAVHKIPRYAAENAHIFTPQVHLPLLDMHMLQSEGSTFVAGFEPRIATMARNIMIPFTLGNTEFPSRLAAELALLRTLTEFNRIEIQQYVSSSPFKSEKMNEYLARAEHLNIVSRQTLANISARKNKEQEQEEGFQIVANQKEENVIEALRAFAAQKTEKNLNELVMNKQEGVDATAHKGLLSTLEEQFTSELNILARYVNAVEQNKEALIAGVTVTPVRGVDLGLIE